MTRTFNVNRARLTFVSELAEVRVCSQLRHSKSVTHSYHKKSARKSTLRLQYSNTNTRTPTLEHQRRYVSSQVDALHCLWLHLGLDDITSLSALLKYTNLNRKQIESRVSIQIVGGRKKKLEETIALVVACANGHEACVKCLLTTV